MLETNSGQSARQVHLALKSALQKMAEAEKCAVICFGEIMARKLYRELGYSSINHYAEAELGFSARRTRDFVALSQKLADLPRLKKEVESGNLGYTAARVIAPIVDQNNEQGWVDFATTHSRRELEREVKTAKREAAETAKGQATLLPVPRQAPAAVVPVRVSLEMTPTQFARYESLWEQIRKQGGMPADQVETLLAVMQSFTAETGPRGPENQATRPPAQIHIHHCEECGKASVQTSRGELAIGAAELTQAQCDCQVSRPGQRNTTSIPPATRRRVLAAARHQCQRPGCNHTRYLEVHHKVPRSQGGTNEPDNLICLCSACHRLLHDKNPAVSWVKSPAAVYRWRTGAIAVRTNDMPTHTKPGSPNKNKSNQYAIISRLPEYGTSRDFVLDGLTQLAMETHRTPNGDAKWLPPAKSPLANPAGNPYYAGKPNFAQRTTHEPYPARCRSCCPANPTGVPGSGC